MRAPSTRLPFADGEYEFALAIGELRELEAKTGAGLGALDKRLRAGDWHADDAFHIIRLGLIGGGVPALEALRLCETYVMGRPLGPSNVLALMILMVRIYPTEEKKAPAPGEAETPRAGSTSPASMPPAS